MIRESGPFELDACANEPQSFRCSPSVPFGARARALVYILPARPAAKIPPPTMPARDGAREARFDDGMQHQLALAADMHSE